MTINQQKSEAGSSKSKSSFDAEPDANKNVRSHIVLTNKFLDVSLKEISESS